MSNQKFYGLLQNGKSGEIHIFEWNDDRRNKFYFEKRDFCLDNEYFYGENNNDCILEFYINGKYRDKFSENDIRFICSKIGRGICGNCISNLYGTNNLDKNDIDQAIKNLQRYFNAKYRQ